MKMLMYHKAVKLLEITQNRITEKKAIVKQDSRLHPIGCQIQEEDIT